MCPYVLLGELVEVVYNFGGFAEDKNPKIIRGPCPAQKSRHHGLGFAV